MKTINLLTDTQSFIEVHPVWEVPKSPELFKSPCLEITIQSVVIVDGKKAATAHKQRTIEPDLKLKNQLAACLTDMYERYVHPSMRFFLEVGITREWYELINSPQFVSAYKAWKTGEAKVEELKKTII